MDSHIKTRIDSLLDELKPLLPVTPLQEAKLNEKLELEFNYNSNHLEGNTLTYTETKQLLRFDETGGKHTLREYEEMKAGETALALIKELAADKAKTLTEDFIKHLNEVLLVRPYWKEAMTPDGQPAKRQISVGEYKMQRNSVLLKNGKVFDYASPAETPVLMQELLEWYGTEEEKKRLHPAELAALLHYKFVCIHPFDDGNGRLSRLLMNYVLYKNSLPPVVVKSEDKSSYCRALHEADAGNVQAFVTYIAEQLAHSLQLYLKAAKGESLEEGEDWRKKLGVLKKDLSRKESLAEMKSVPGIQKLINFKIYPFVKLVCERLGDFRDFFLQTAITVDKSEKTYPLYSETALDIENHFKQDLNTHICFYHFTKKQGASFSIDVKLHFIFNQYNYFVTVEPGLAPLFVKLYHQDFVAEDIEMAANECGKILLGKIEEELYAEAGA